MAIAFRSASTGNATATSVGAPKPAGATPQDVFLAHVSAWTTAAFSPPTGWASVISSSSAQFGQLKTFIRIVDGTEGPTLTFTFPSVVSSALTIECYSGVDTTSPINSSDSSLYTALATSASAPGVTTTVDNVEVMRIFGGSYPASAAFTITPASGTTRANALNQTATDSRRIVVADAVEAKATRTTGSVSASSNGAPYWITHTVALTPAAVGVQTQALWNVQALAGAQGQALFDARALVDGQTQALWNVRTTAGVQRQALWTPAALAGRSIQQIFSVAQNISAQKQALWNVRSSVGAEEQALWPVRALSRVDAQALWSAAQNIGAQRQAVWPIRASIGSERQALWPIRTLSHNDAQLPWSVAQDIGSQAQALWKVRALAGTQRETLWNTASSVGAEQQALWPIGSLVNNESQVLWGVRALVAEEREALWNVLSLVPTAASNIALSWQVQALLDASIDAHWHCFSGAGTQRQALWQGASLSRSDAQALWRARGLSRLDAQALWHIRSLSHRDAQAQWAIRKLTHEDLSLLWQVARAVRTAAQDATASWRVRKLAGLRVSLEWSTDALIVITSAGPIPVETEERMMHLGSDGRMFASFAERTHKVTEEERMLGAEPEGRLLH